MNKPHSIVEVDLKFEYLLEKEPITVVTPWVQSPAPAPPGVLVLPIKVGGGEAASGQLHVTVPRKLLENRAIDRHTLVLTDTHNTTHKISALYVQERLERESAPDD